MWFSIATLNYQRAIAFSSSREFTLTFSWRPCRETYLHERNRMMYPISSDGSACFTNHTDISHKSVAPWPPKHSPVLVCGIARPTIPVLLSPPVTCSAIEACPNVPRLGRVQQLSVQLLVVNAGRTMKTSKCSRLSDMNSQQMTSCTRKLMNHCILECPKMAISIGKMMNLVTRCHVRFWLSMG